MNFQRALVVEDYPQIVYLLRPLLRSCQFVVDHAISLNTAELKLEKLQYDLVILDRNLPDGDGLELMQTISEHSTDTKILVLSERGLVHEKVAGLKAGADDYLAKPFSSDEFIARVQAIMRRASTLKSTTVSVGVCSLSLGEARLAYGNNVIQLSKREAHLIDLLVRHPHHVIDREKIALNLWTMDKYPSSSSIDTFMKRLRDKLSSTPVKIKTRYNLGYELSV